MTREFSLLKNTVQGFWPFIVVVLGLILILLWLDIVIAPAADPIDETQLQNVDDKTNIILSQFRYNRVSRTYFGSAEVTNISPDALTKPMYLVVNAITPENVTVLKPHGTTVSEKPYYDLSPLIEGDTLEAGAVTNPLTLEISNPQGVQFQMDLSVYIAGIPSPNNPPVITSTPVTTATEDALYTYDVEATDADDDPLTFALTTLPDGMTIDSNTGIIQWTPTNAQAGISHPVTVQVSDGKAEATQAFEIAVVNVNDALTYAWTFGDGDVGTGLQPAHVYAAAGVYTVRLTVDDGHGGTDTDETARREKYRYGIRLLLWVRVSETLPLPAMTQIIHR